MSRPNQCIDACLSALVIFTISLIVGEHANFGEFLAANDRVQQAIDADRHSSRPQVRTAAAVNIRHWEFAREPTAGVEHNDPSSRSAVGVGNRDEHVAISIDGEGEGRPQWTGRVGLRRRYGRLYEPVFRHHADDAGAAGDRFQND